MTVRIPTPDRGIQRALWRLTGKLALRLEVWTLIWHAGGRWRLNGELSVSRSLGDLPYAPHGLIADPTLSGWIDVSPAAPDANLAASKLPSGHQWLLLASDGVFESMQPGEVCEAAHAFASGALCSMKLPSCQ